MAIASVKATTKTITKEVLVREVVLTLSLEEAIVLERITNLIGGHPYTSSQGETSARSYTDKIGVALRGAIAGFCKVADWECLCSGAIKMKDNSDKYVQSLIKE